MNDTLKLFTPDFYKGVSYSFKDMNLAELRRNEQTLKNMVYSCQLLAEEVARLTDQNIREKDTFKEQVESCLRRIKELEQKPKGWAKRRADIVSQALSTERKYEVLLKRYEERGEVILALDNERKKIDELKHELALFKSWHEREKKRSKDLEATISRRRERLNQFENENNSMKSELEHLRKENAHLKAVLRIYEPNNP